MKITKMLLTPALIAALTVFAPMCASAGISLPTTSNDYIDESTLYMIPMSSDKVTELGASNTSIWSYEKLLDGVKSSNFSSSAFTRGGRIIGFWGPFEKSTDYTEDVKRLRIDMGAAADVKLNKWGYGNIYMYYVSWDKDDASSDMNMITGGWLTSVLYLSGDYQNDASMDYVTVPTDYITSKDWNTNKVYAVLIKADGDDSDSGGCSVGFGAIALLAPIPLFFGKKKKNK